MSAPDATWRVYLAEWLIVFTSDADGPAGAAECLDHRKHKYEGRVREEEWQVVPAIAGQPPGGTYCLQLKLPNLRGEYKDHEDALALVLPLGSAVVQRGSAEEQALLEYGRKMLPDAG